MFHLNSKEPWNSFLKSKRFLLGVISLYKMQKPIKKNIKDWFLKQMEDRIQAVKTIMYANYIQTEKQQSCAMNL